MLQTAILNWLTSAMVLKQAQNVPTLILLSPVDSIDRQNKNVKRTECHLMFSFASWHVIYVIIN